MYLLETIERLRNFVAMSRCLAFGLTGGAPAQTGAQGTVCRYRYDAFHRRVEKQVFAANDSALTDLSVQTWERCQSIYL